MLQICHVEALFFHSEMGKNLFREKGDVVLAEYV